jgi:hypothetical protein
MSLKKNTTKKNLSPPELIEKTGKKCPTGYETDKKDKTKCRRKTAKKAKSKTPSPKQVSPIAQPVKVALPSEVKVPEPAKVVLEVKEPTKAAVLEVKEPTKAVVLEPESAPNSIPKVGKKCPPGYRADPKNKERCVKTKK